MHVSHTLKPQAQCAFALFDSSLAKITVFSISVLQVCACVREFQAMFICMSPLRTFNATNFPQAENQHV